MTVKLDAKFDGTIRKVKDGSIVPDDQYIVFLIKDNAFWMALQHYRKVCKSAGCDENQLAAVDRMIERGRVWRDENRNLCKWPDISEGEKLLE